MSHLHQIFLNICKTDYFSIHIFILCHVKTREKRFASLTSDTVTFESSAPMFVQNC